jgi:hemolysin D
MATQRNKHELQFLPAALEIQETPPSPIGRAITWSIIVLFLIAILWACLGQIDIVATAQGKVVPSDRTKLIQPLEIGAVSAIHVHEGQSVKRGDTLIELDTTNTQADATRLGNEYSTTQAELARATALVNAMQTHTPPKAHWPKSISSDVLQPQKQLLTSQWQQHQATLNSLDNEQTRRQAELAGTEEQIKKLTATLPLITERAESLKTLADKQLAARNDYLQLEQQRIEQTQDLAAQQQHRHELIANLAQLKEQRNAEESDALNKALAELTDAKRRSQGLNQETIKADSRNQSQRLTAPVDGVVQQLAVHTIGGVVTPAQQLMVIVPNEESIEVEAIIANKDIGFVHEGQTAEVKVDAFPFTRYGTIDAQLVSVSSDAIQDEKLGLLFTARVLLKQSTMRIEEKIIHLSPGMAVTVEVKTGKRRLIEYILSPLMQHVSESGRER